MSDDTTSAKVTVKLDKKGRFNIEALRPILAEKTDAIHFYEIEQIGSGEIMLKLFDKEGNKI